MTRNLLHRAAWVATVSLLGLATGAGGGPSACGQEANPVEGQSADRPLADGDGEGKNFDGRDLVGVPVHGEFARASFRGANLTNASLFGDFRGATFDDAIVTGALFMRADGTESQRDDLRERGAIVDGAGLAAEVAAGRTFENGAFACVDFSGEDLSGGHFRRGSFFSGHAEGTSFRNADLAGADMHYVQADGACFDGATLAGAELGGLWAQQGSFRGTNLARAEIHGARLSGADFSGADLTGADLRHADLTGANLEGALIDGVDVEAAILDDVRGLDEATLAELRGRAQRWRYDLEEAWDDFRSRAALPGYFLSAITGIALGIAGWTLGRLRGSFATLAGINVAALIPLGCFVLLLLAGGSPVAQMTSSYDAWSWWLGIWPALVLGTLLAIPCSIGVGIWHVARKAMKGPRRELPLSIGLAIVTPLACFLAFSVLFQIAPDA